MLVHGPPSISLESGCPRALERRQQHEGEKQRRAISIPRLIGRSQKGAKLPPERIIARFRFSSIIGQE